jgi:hypothetical protein
MDQIQPDGQTARRQERLLLLEQMRALHRQMAIVSEQTRDVDRHLHALPGPLVTTTCQPLLALQRLLRRQMAALLEHQDVLRRYWGLLGLHTGPEGHKQAGQPQLPGSGWSVATQNPTASTPPM